MYVEDVLQYWNAELPKRRCRRAPRQGFFLEGQLSYILLFQCGNVDAINASGVGNAGPSLSILDPLPLQK